MEEKKIKQLEPVFGPDLYYAEILNPEENELRALLGITLQEAEALQMKLFDIIAKSTCFTDILLGVQTEIKHVNHVYYLMVTLGYKMAKDKYDIKSALVDEIVKQQPATSVSAPISPSPSPSSRPHITIKPVKRKYSGGGATLATEDITGQPTF